jgi:LDH2 family malate/lactate/ureidoglycolate dehydrogenase
VGPKQQEPFKGMKDRLCTAPILAYPNFQLPYILNTDVSRTALGAILSQVQGGIETTDTDQYSGRQHFRFHHLEY